MNIDELEAGPELDALVAEKVMGWQWNIRNGICYAEHDTFNAPDCWPAFSPSTDIAAAWEVVEKLATTGLTPEIDLRGAGWAVAFVDYTSIVTQINSKHTCIDKSAPLAICRAALKAVGK